MEEFIKEIEERIQYLQKHKSDINIAKVFELTLVVRRLKALILPVVGKALKERDDIFVKDCLNAKKGEPMMHEIDMDGKCYKCGKQVIEIKPSVTHQL